MLNPVCLDCIGDPHLRNELASAASQATCCECGETGPAVALKYLAEQIDTAFRRHYERTHFEESPGAAVIFSEIAGVDPDLAWRIEQHLYEELGKEADFQAAENPYDYSTGFAPCRTPIFWQDRRWERFCDSLRKKARHINAEAMSWLDDVFADLDSHRTSDQMPVIKEICPGEVSGHFYRARVAWGEKELRTILQEPVKQLGPLPPGFGNGGRLNAPGIPAFYGAVDVKTCVAEIRPPVGAHVVVARFDILRPLRLLDCEALDRLIPQASPFDPDFATKRDRAHFLRTFSDQIARPVLPGDETQGYVPTQVIAEYLADRLARPIDGILYRSTQRGAELGNVMLFNRAARVEAFPHHSHHIEVWIRQIDIDNEDFDDSISLDVQEIGAPSPSGPFELLDDPPRDPIPDPLPATFAQADIDDDRLPSLRLIPETIAVHAIRSIDYAWSERHVKIGSSWPDSD